MAWQGGATLPAFVAVTAVEDGTAVTVTSTAAVAAGDLQALEPGAPASATLNRGDVLELLAYGGDLTGTRIVADKPIQAVGGHFCATVPADFPSCDHVEEVLPPTPALGTAYVLAKPVMSTSSKPVVVRVVALEDGTALSYAPGVPGAPGTLDAGQFADFELWLTDGIVEILANRPVLVAEYLAAQGAGGIDGWGDPSLVIAQPVTRWRTAYELHVPDTIVGGWVDVLAPAGGRVTLEGEPLPALRSEGGYALGYANVAGAKRVVADVPFTMWTYGHGSGWSYWYAPAVAP